MAKLPEPPEAETLAELKPEIDLLPQGSWVWRLYFRGGPHPTGWDSFRSFGPTAARFDHHLTDADGRPRVQGREILYGAREGPSCLAEAFQETRVIDRFARKPWLVAFEIVRSLSLLDLTGAWPTRAGASMAIASGPRPRCRRWAQAIYLAYPELDGLLYGASMHANRPAYAVFERAKPALPPRPVFHRGLGDPVLGTVLENAAEDLGYGLA